MSVNDCNNFYFEGLSRLSMRQSNVLHYTCHRGSLLCWDLDDLEISKLYP